VAFDGDDASPTSIHEPLSVGFPSVKLLSMDFRPSKFRRAYCNIASCCPMFYRPTSCHLVVLSYSNPTSYHTKVLRTTVLRLVVMSSCHSVQHF
jgi:hypothetical protein